jgi:type III pantothenate kinase
MQSSAQALPLLVVETGNTTTGFTVIRERVVVRTSRISTESLALTERPELLLQPLVAEYPDMRDAVLCSVVPTVSAMLQEVLSQLLQGTVLHISSSLRLPFVLQYESPEAFGADRIALCAAGRKLFPDRPLIALDVGTAITVDVLGSTGLYLGGFIMPGINLMARSLHDRTAQLPLITVIKPGELLGHSTAACIRNGIYWGCIAQIEGLAGRVMRSLREEGEGEPAIIITGGNAPSVLPSLHLPVLLVEHAVALGAHYLYELNAP